MIIANSRYGRRDIKTDIKNQIKNELDGKFAAIDSEFATIRGEFAAIRGEFAAIRGELAAIRGKFADLQAKQEVKHEVTQRLILSLAIPMMKAIDGDKTEMRELVKEAEKQSRCNELGEDCPGQEVVNCDNTEMRESVKGVEGILSSIDFEGWPKVDNCDKTEMGEFKDAEKLEAA